MNVVYYDKCIDYVGNELLPGDYFIYTDSGRCSTLRFARVLYVTSIGKYYPSHYRGGSKYYEYTIYLVYGEVKECPTSSGLEIKICDKKTVLSHPNRRAFKINRSVIPQLLADKLDELYEDKSSL